MNEFLPFTSPFYTKNPACDMLFEIENFKQDSGTVSRTRAWLRQPVTVHSPCLPQERRPANETGLGPEKGMHMKSLNSIATDLSSC